MLVGFFFRKTMAHWKNEAPIPGACGAASFPEEGGYSTKPCINGVTKNNPVTLILYSSPPGDNTTL
jgi:hypothetical protein